MGHVSKDLRPSKGRLEACSNGTQNLSLDESVSSTDAMFLPSSAILENAARSGEKQRFFKQRLSIIPLVVQSSLTINNYSRFLFLHTLTFQRLHPGFTVKKALLDLKCHRFQIIESIRVVSEQRNSTSHFVITNSEASKN
ncbi:hypothetical protein CEXT_679111 [Caerostris extrusa]|uniref:Uncharacterized protein n=1 Tax=Caerostris extrusa TaxID=172846 RepID=A0AAV4SRT2_CAEEX|nr:hypothetical protein CEXT_679111 [Caerostris extrusa]